MTDASSSNAVLVTRRRRGAPYRRRSVSTSSIVDSGHATLCVSDARPRRVTDISAACDIDASVADLRVALADLGRRPQTDGAHVVLDVHIESGSSLSTDGHQLLEEWKQLTRSYAQLHDASHRYFRRLNACIAGPVFLLCASVGVLNFAGVGGTASDEDRSIAVRVGMGLLSAAAAALSAGSNVLALGERAGQHKACGVAFDKLARDIDVGTVLQRSHNRVYLNNAELIKHLRERIDALVSQSPNVPSRILSRFGAQMHTNHPSIRVHRGTSAYDADGPASERSREGVGTLGRM